MYSMCVCVCVCVCVVMTIQVCTVACLVWTSTAREARSDILSDTGKKKEFFQEVH